ncbi:hypothetical protein [Yoonia sp. 2307UL14-13]|uniref:hypothetical protein n=1 Tax=Yoonia sp. 2307UL14-13 TaxID=3126506 RepID=UPI0030AFFA0B
MTCITHLQPFPAPAPTDVIMLRCADIARLDPQPLRRMCAERGVEAVEDHLCKTLEDIVILLDQLQAGLAQGDFSTMKQPSHRIAQIADRIGLVDVSMSANHVATCLQQQDGVALEATMARLERSFDLAVSEVWRFQVE